MSEVIIHGRKVDSQEIHLGLYVILWNPTLDEVGRVLEGLAKEKIKRGFSFASVGRDANGMACFAPANWINVPSYQWELVSELVPLDPRRLTWVDDAGQTRVHGGG